MSLKKMLKRDLITLVITSLVASALVGIVVILLGSFDDIENKILITTFATGTFSLLGLANIRGLESSNRGYVWTAYSGLALSFITVLIVISTIWLDYSPYPWRLVLILTILVISFAHLSLLFPSARIASDNYVVILVTMTVPCIVVVAGILTSLVIVGNAYEDRTIFRILSVFAILDVLGTILSPLSLKLRVRK